ISAPPKIRMRADRAYLRETRRRQSPPCHRSESAIDANPNEPAEIGSMRAERPRLRETRKRHHLWKIRGSHRQNRLPERWSIRNRRADHLNQSSIADKLPPLRNLS